MNDIEYLNKYLDKKKLPKAIKKLKKGIPVQYIVGNVSFYGYDINVNKNVLIPRFETEELVENSIKYIKNNFNLPLNVLEIGTGSGCISIAIKKELDNISITATDISKKALKVAKNNAKMNNVDIKFINTDIYKGIDDKFDVIISNPPYISEDEEIMEIVRKNEPNIALFADNNGLYFYEEILKNARKILKDKYLICFEIGMTQAKEIEKMANKYLKEAKVDIKKDMQQRDRMVFIYNFE